MLAESGVELGRSASPNCVSAGTAPPRPTVWPDPRSEQIDLGSPRWRARHRDPSARLILLTPVTFGSGRRTHAGAVLAQNRRCF